MNKVLVVDDDELVVAGLLVALEDHGFDAASAYDRESAESLITNTFFPIILADVRLHSEEEGLQLLESIRRISPRSRVASLTGLTTPSLEETLLELGATLVLRKPLGCDEIVAVLSEIFAELVRVEEASPEASVEELYLAAERVMYSIPQRRYGLSRDDAEELVQQAWLLFLEKRKSIRMPRPWLAGTIANLCKQEVQRRIRDRDLARAHVVEEAFSDTHATEAGIAVRQALARLDDRSRALCEWIGLERLSYDEVSERAGIPLGSVGPLFIRAKTKLKKAMH
ncbi:MAG TPA: sigma-70 family RNA polymerase sigma factor [Thermoanaerobaculia bacterium]